MSDETLNLFTTSRKFLNNWNLEIWKYPNAILNKVITILKYYVWKIEWFYIILGWNYNMIYLRAISFNLKFIEFYNNRRIWIILCRLTVVFAQWGPYVSRTMVTNRPIFVLEFCERLLGIFTLLINAFVARSKTRSCAGHITFFSILPLSKTHSLLQRSI